MDFGLDPFGLGTDPFGLRTGPFGLQTDPFGLWTDPFGLRTDPFGLHTDPFGLQTDPFGLQTESVSFPKPLCDGGREFRSYFFSLLGRRDQNASEVVGWRAVNNCAFDRRAARQKKSLGPAHPTHHSEGARGKP